MENKMTDDLQITQGIEHVLTGQKKEEFEGLFSVIAPYWLNGLHNKDGIEYANTVNRRIKESGLEENRDGIAQLLEADELAKKYMLGVISRKRFLEDPHLNANFAEPAHLVDKMFTRDKDGAYRPSAGGAPVLVDKKDSLTLKGKSQDSYRAAVELAAAKGWTAIELKGKPAMMAGVWLEAQMLGVRVVGYEPTEQDKKRLAEKIAERDKDKPQPTYALQYEYEGKLVEEKFGNVKDAAAAFSDVPGFAKPAVMRTIMRDGIPDMKVIADTLGQGALLKKLVGKDDPEFSAAFEIERDAVKIQEEKKQIQPQAQPDKMKDGPLTGKILDVRDGVVFQKKGLDGVVKHSLDSLTRTPVIGAVETITFKGGRGIVEDRLPQKQKELELAR